MSTKEKVLSFEQFKATKKRLTKLEAEELIGTDIYSPHVLVYLDQFHIEELIPSMQYSMVIGRCDWVEKDLHFLEVRLYLYYLEEWSYESDVPSYELIIKHRVKYEILGDDAWYW